MPLLGVHVSVAIRPPLMNNWNMPSLTVSVNMFHVFGAIVNAVVAGLELPVV